MRKVSSLRRSVYLLAALQFTALPLAAEAACSARSDGRGLCPFQAGPVVFDRCFGAPLTGSRAGKPAALGNTVCDSAKAAKRLQNQVGSNINGWKRSMQRDFNDFVDVTTRGTKGPDALAAYNRAAGVWNSAVAEVERLGRDRQCGPNGAIKQAETWFKQTEGNIQKIGQIGGKVGDAIKATAPAAPAAAKFAQEAAALASELAKSGSSAKKEAEKVKKSAQAVARSVDAVVKMNPVGLAADGLGIVRDVGSFSAASGVCLASIAETVAAFVGGGGGSVATAAACLTGAGCAAPLTAAGGAAAGTGGGLIVGGVTCDKAVDDASQIATYVDKVIKFVEGSVKLAVQINKAVDDTGKAVAALDELAKKVDSNSKSRIAAMGKALADVSQGLDAGLKVVQRDVAPPMQRLGESMLSDLAGHTETMVSCYHKVKAATGRLTHRSMQAGLDTLKQAGGAFSDGATVINNIVNQSDAALRAANRELAQRWAQVDRDSRDLYQDIFGVRAYDVNVIASAGHMTRNLTNLNRARGLLRDAQSLARERDAAIAAALNVGKETFLGRNDSNDAKRSFQQTIQKARSAESQMKRARVKATPARLPRVTAKRLPLAEFSKAQRARVAKVNVSALTRAVRASKAARPAASSKGKYASSGLSISRIRASKGGYLILGEGFGRNSRAVRLLENRKTSKTSKIVSIRDDRIEVQTSRSGRFRVQVQIGKQRSNEKIVTLR